MPRPGVEAVPYDPFVGRGVAIAELDVRKASAEGISMGPGAFDRSRLLSRALEAANRRYSLSRLISSSTRGAKSQRKTHFPRFTIKSC